MIAFPTPRIQRALLQLNWDEQQIQFDASRSGVISIDCIGDAVFKANDLAYVTYALNTNYNKSRLNDIDAATDANYQRDLTSQWLWDDLDCEYDIIALLECGLRPLSKL
jgi:phosphoribosyl-dephospho-CoA transferase